MEGELRCLGATLRIDHRVADACLPRILALLAERYALVAAKNEEGLFPLRQACRRIVGEVADTHARLRQVGKLLRAFLTLEEEGEDGGREAVRALVADAEVLAALGRAIRDCPPPQFVPLWDLLASQEEEEKGEAITTTRRLGQGGVRFRLLLLLLGHLRVSALNAAALGGRAAAAMARVRCVVVWRLMLFIGVCAHVACGVQRRCVL